MSGLVSGITKIFSSLGTGVATLGSAVRAAGASLFTGMAATGQSAMGGGLSSMFSGTGGILSNLFSGINNVLGLGSPTASALIDSTVTSATGATGAVGATAAEAATPATGYGSDVWTKAMTGGLNVANTATGMEPAGASAATAAATGSTGGGLLKGLGSFLGSNAGAALIGGIGESLGREREITALENMKEADRQFELAKQQRITDSYKVPNSALVGGTQTPFGTPGSATVARAAWKYNPNTGMIEVA